MIWEIAFFATMTVGNISAKDIPIKLQCRIPEGCPKNVGAVLSLFPDESEGSNSFTPDNCTGFLIENDLLVTAGHCISEALIGDIKKSCHDKISFIQPGAEPIACKEILSSSTGNADYAFIRLETSASSFEPLVIKSDGLGDGEKLDLYVTELLSAPNKNTSNQPELQFELRKKSCVSHTNPQSKRSTTGYGKDISFAYCSEPIIGGNSGAPVFFGGQPLAILFGYIDAGLNEAILPSAKPLLKSKDTQVGYATSFRCLNLVHKQHFDDNSCAPISILEAQESAFTRSALVETKQLAAAERLKESALEIIAEQEAYNSRMDQRFRWRLAQIYNNKTKPSYSGVIFAPYCLRMPISATIRFETNTPAIILHGGINRYLVFDVELVDSKIPVSFSIFPIRTDSFVKSAHLMASTQDLGQIDLGIISQCQ